MKRIAIHVAPLMLLFLVACGSGSGAVLEPQGDEASVGEPTEVSAATADVAVTPATENPSEPTHARDRDWKQGNAVDPAVTIIEYGDFQ